MAAVGALALFGTTAAPAGPLSVPRGDLAGTASLAGAGARMVPLSTPAAIARVAVVPGSRDHEAWAFGFAQGVAPGYDSGTQVGQSVFLRSVDDGPWQIVGPPTDAGGAIVNPQLAGIAMAADGEGYAVGTQGSIFHHTPGHGWVQLASSPTRNELDAVALGADASGVYGYAVGVNLTVLRLSAGTWSLDVTTSPQGGSTTIPQLVGVSVVDRDHAWAIGQKNPDQLSLWQRTQGAWTAKPTGDPIFDTPPYPVAAGNSVTINQIARGTAIWAGPSTVWVTGAMQPVDAVGSVGGSVSSIRTRPFALRYDVATQTFTSFCPRVYQLSNSGVDQTIDVCDHPFPFAVGDLPVVQGFSDGEAFAAGYGAFRYRDGRWTRAPSTLGYIASGSFFRPDDGWLASPGSTAGGTGVITSTATTAGHWTRGTGTPHLTRWTTPATQPLTAIARSPAAPARAMAVGLGGTIVAVDRGVGADVMRSPSDEALTSIAWPSADEAWAVGAGGTILRFDGTRWTLSRASGLATTKTLFSVAFRAPGYGFAVGDGGVILRCAAGIWSVDRTYGGGKPLFGVAFAGDRAYAVGAGATVLESDRGGPWRALGYVKAMLPNNAAPDQLVTLVSVAGLPDGTVVASGTGGALIERDPGGVFHLSGLPAPYGTPHSLAIARDAGGALSVYAAIGSRIPTYVNGHLADPAGWPFRGAGGKWFPLGEGRATPSEVGVEAPVLRDAVYGFAIDPNGRNGWAVGGYPGGGDEDGHFSFSGDSSLWRLDTMGTPAPSPEDAGARVTTPPGTVSFAFASDLSCASGYCSSGLGLGGRGDTMTIRALQEIDALARRGTVRFVALGGDLRSSGIPDDYEAIRSLLDGLPVPSFSAIGDRDLFSGGVNAGGQGTLRSPGYFLQAMNDRPQPWGHGARVPGFVPVSVAGETASATEARTHYAFDYAPGGHAVLRMIFADTSRTPLAASTQNPAAPDQTSWLASVLSGAQALGIPSIVVMHQPLVAGLSTNADAGALTSALTAGGVSAVLAGHVHLDQQVPVGAAGVGFPAVTGGTTGGLLDGAWQPSAGAYHAWHLVTVRPVRSSLGAASSVSISAIPILESVALSAPHGRSVGAGSTLPFTALGRAPDSGSANSGGSAVDGRELNATYLHLPLAPRCSSLLGSGSDCTPANVEVPSYSFSCEDARLCAFVREDPDVPGRPLVIGGALTADPLSGLMCAVNAGTTYVRVQAGLFAARVPVTIRGGSGPCVKYPILPASVTRAIARAHAAHPVPQPHVPVQILHPHQPAVAAVGAIAPPIVNAAPAPPAGGGGQREEQREAAGEKAEFRALPVRTRSTMPQGAGVLAIVTVLAFIGARTARSRTTARPEPSYVRIDHRRNH